MNQVSFSVIGSGLVFAAVGLVLYRLLLRLHEDDLLRLAAGAEKLIPDGISPDNRLCGVDPQGGGGGRRSR